MKIKITNIKWDTDGEFIAELPLEIEQEFDFNEIGDEYEMASFLSDWLSDTYGFCQFGFNFDVIKL